MVLAIYSDGRHTVYDLSPSFACAWHNLCVKLKLKYI